MAILMAHTAEGEGTLNVFFESGVSDERWVSSATATKKRNGIEWFPTAQFEPTFQSPLRLALRYIPNHQLNNL